MTSLFTEPLSKLAPANIVLKGLPTQSLSSPVLLEKCFLPEAQSQNQSAPLTNDGFIGWMKSVYQEKVSLKLELGSQETKRKIKSQLNLLEGYYSHRRTEFEKSQQVTFAKQEQLADLGGSLRYVLERRLLLRDLDVLKHFQDKQEDSLRILEHAHRQARPELHNLFSKVENNDVYGKTSFTVILEQIQTELEKLLRYHQISTKITLEANQELYRRNGFVRAIKKFRDEVVPQALRSSLPIAGGLLAYQQFGFSVDMQSGLLPIACGLVTAASTAAVIGLGLALKQGKAGETLEDNIRTAIRSTGKTLAIGAGIHAIIFGQAYLEHLGVAFDVGWQKVLFYSALGGMINATIGYFMDVAELVGDKIDKFYKPKIDRYYQLNPELKKDSFAQEVLQFRWLVNDLSSADDRYALIAYLKEEGVNTVGLTKSILFDLTVGAVFGLVGARLNMFVYNSKDAMKTLFVQGASKLLAWAEKTLSRSVRSSLVSPMKAGSRRKEILPHLKETVEDLLETVAEE